jgi:hypothetical protein
MSGPRKKKTEQLTKHEVRGTDYEVPKSFAYPAKVFEHFDEELFPAMSDSEKNTKRLKLCVDFAKALQDKNTSDNKEFHPSRYVSESKLTAMLTTTFAVIADNKLRFTLADVKLQANATKGQRESSARFQKKKLRGLGSPPVAFCLVVLFTQNRACANPLRCRNGQ